MKSMISAIQFLTCLPIGKPGTFEPKTMIQFFPIVGLIIGGIIASSDYILLQFSSKPAISLADMILMIWITGALHLDGLADTADGLYGNRPREKALEIMKDSRVGSMGVVAVWCVLTAKWVGILGLDANRMLILLIVPAYSRAATLFAFRYLEYGRPGGGTGHALFEDRLKLSALWGLIIPVAISLFAGYQGIKLNLLFIVSTVIILIFYKQRMGCVTGDMLGAMTEIIESVLFLTAG